MKIRLILKSQLQLWLSLLATLWLGGQAAVLGADASLAILYKGLSYEQTGPTTVTPRASTNAAELNSFVSMTAPNSLTSASLRSPAPVTNQMLLDGDQFSFQVGFTNQATMDAVFANGSYQISITTAHDGIKTFTLALQGNLYPSTPQINDFNGAQAINPAAPYTLGWQPLAGGTTADLIIVEVSDAETGNGVFKSPGPGEPGALNGTSNSIVIPSGGLTSGKSYDGRLIFFRPVAFDVSTYLGATAAAGYEKKTSFPLSTTGQSDTTSPWLEDAYPGHEDTVALNGSLAFVFSEPMQTGYSINWDGPPGFNSANLTFSWSTNRTTLFCIYNGNLPPSATINWTLNPEGQQNFRDLAGNTLPTQYGSFITGTQTVTPDVSQLIVYKAKYYEQTNAATSTPLTDQPFALGAFVALNTFVTATNASLAGPGPGTVSLNFGGDEFYGEDQYLTKAELDADFPNGSYTFTVNTVHDGTRTVPLTLPADAYPNAPRLGNYAATQTINPAANFTLTWDAFVGGATNDFISVQIDELLPEDSFKVFDSPDFGQPGAFKGTNTSCVIPANTLPPGRQFELQLMFAKVVNTNATSYPGALGVTVFIAETRVLLATTGSPIKPAFQAPSHQNGFFQFNVTGERNMPYTLEYTYDFLDWFTLMSQKSDTGSLQFSDYPPPDDTKRFYRVREGW